MLRLNHWIYHHYHAREEVVDQTTDDCYWLLFFEQPVTMSCDGSPPVELSANAGIIFAPHTPVKYYNVWDGYYHHGVFVKGKQLQPLLDKLNIPVNKPFFVTNPALVETSIKEISQEHRLLCTHQEEREDLMLRLFLYRLSEIICMERAANSPYLRILGDLRRRIYLNPEKKWLAEDEAHLLHISVSRFHHIYRELFSVSLTQDVIRGRVEMAKRLLREGNTAIGEIAARCGYANAEHFSRQFRNNVGCSARKYRQQYGKHMYAAPAFDKSGE